jgi:hypothetical protein
VNDHDLENDEEGVNHVRFLVKTRMNLEGMFRSLDDYPLVGLQVVR